MNADRSLRQRLQSTVLEASTPAGKTYNAVIFGVILLSVLALLLEPDPLGNSALRHHQQRSVEVVCSNCGHQGHRRDARHCDAGVASLPSRA